MCAPATPSRFRWAGRRFAFRVIDIFYDYGSEKGFIVVDRSTHAAVSARSRRRRTSRSMSRQARNLDEVRPQVEQVAAGHNLVIFTNRSLRAEAMQIFDRTFAITYALEVVAVIVAVIGIAGALLALVIDRRRELGLLRFLGAAVRRYAS